jgi:phosphatidylserine/phosphatidylglycerophosphate/cardiolipin synthase-like enzyme
MIVDNKTYIGSSNFNFRSSYLDLELDVEIPNKKMILKMVDTLKSNSFKIKKHNEGFLIKLFSFFDIIKSNC